MKKEVTIFDLWIEQIEADNRRAFFWGIMKISAVVSLGIIAWKL